jgi:SsrA-binding protein
MGKEITNNKKAYFNYEILEKFEAGIVLTGPEIKAIRAGKINISGAHAKVLGSQSRRDPGGVARDQSRKDQSGHRKQEAGNNNPELFLINANIQTKDKTEATKTRKLLMHRNEIAKLIGKTQQKNLTLIPLSVYINRGKAKIELGLGRGKKLHDKRETIKKRDLDREF